MLVQLLQRLLSLLKSGGEAVGTEVLKGYGVEVLIELLGSLCTHPTATEAILRILKHLTRQGEELGVCFAL